jgi:4-amino-4-deoxy-L-arabinose transferase-like glycosyltransferase
MTVDATAVRVAGAIGWILTGLFFAITFFVAVVIPIHAQDALTFGEWSRLISEHWHLHYAAATAQEYGRPLFYVLQGWLWGLLGFSEVTGRVLSGLFSLLLLGALAWLVRGRPAGELAAVMAALALVATPVFAIQAVSGLTDIPVAALVALAAALVWNRCPGRARALTAGVVSALAMLAKPSALLALLGLAAAQVLVREPWRSRLLYRIAPVTAGMALGLLYDVVQARHVHQGLRTFLQAGVNTDYYRTLAGEARRFVLLDAGWFGDGLRVAVIFSLAYTLLRVAGVRHRLSVLAAVPASLLGSWLGPWLAAREARITVGSLHSTGAALSALGTAAFLALGARAYTDTVSSRSELARLCVWALPTAAAWALYGAYDLRLLAPAWPPLLALVALTALPAAVALARRGALAIALALALFAIVVANNVYNIDGLGKSGWSEVRRTPAREWSQTSTMRAIVMPAFTRALAAVRPQMSPQDLLISPEGAFRFFFPGRVEQSFPNTCENLHRFRVFVLLTDEGSKRYMEDFLHVSSDPGFWASCSRPRLKQLTDGSEGYAVFRVDR